MSSSSFFHKIAVLLRAAKTFCRLTLTFSSSLITITCMSRDEATEYAALIAQELSELNETVESDGEAVSTWLNETALDLNVFSSVLKKEGIIVEILRTCGGPRCEIQLRSDEEGWLTVNAWWGISFASKRVHARRLWQELNEYGHVVVFANEPW